MKRKNTFNENYFENIDSEEKAYWLGFICSDGYINARGNTVGISLDSKDESHLLKFLESIEYKGKGITYTESSFSKNYRKTKKAHVRLFSRKMHLDLRNLGITSTKSKDLKPLSCKLNKKLAAHFIRGCYDGDGCIFDTYIKKKDKKYYSAGLTLVGTFDFLTYVNENLPFRVKSLNFDKRTQGSYTLYILSKKRFKIMYNFLYKNSKIFLDRKMQKSKEIMKNIEGSSETTMETSLSGDDGIVQPFMKI